MPDYEGGPSLRRTAGLRISSEKLGAMSLNADIDPPPTPWPFAPALALLAVLFFISLQFALPATHVRHPADRHRNWIPISELKARTHEKGDISELIQLDMQDNPLAGVEDCTQDFEKFFSMNLLEAARLSSGNGKPQLPMQPYKPNTCLFDKGTLVIDKKRWSESNITEVVHWWIAMYHKTEENLYSNGHVELPVQLALYQKYKGLDASWNVREPLTFAKATAAKLIHFDKQHKPWHQTKPTNFEKDIMGLWWKYLSPSTNLMFNSQ